MQEIFMSKCTKKHLEAGLRPDPTGEPKRFPKIHIDTVGGHREETKSSHSLAAVRCAKCREGRQEE